MVAKEAFNIDGLGKKVIDQFWNLKLIKEPSDIFKLDYEKIENCNWVTYLSATSVYGDHKGNWVNEDSATEPTSENGLNRLEAEKNWKSLSNKKNYPLQIFRLAGIYSKEFNILKRLKTGKVQIVDKKERSAQKKVLVSQVLEKAESDFPDSEKDDKLCIKVDDVDFNKTNPGVWTMSMNHFKQSSGFTSWNEYKQDEPIEDYAKKENKKAV